MLNPLRYAALAWNYPPDAHNLLKRHSACSKPLRAAQGETSMTESSSSKPSRGSSAASLIEKVVLKAISQPNTSPQPPDPSNPAFANAAVARCAHAHASVIQTAISQRKEPWQYSGDAGAAYRNACPRSPGRGTSAISSPAPHTPCSSAPSTAQREPGSSMPPRSPTLPTTRYPERRANPAQKQPKNPREMSIFRT